MLPGGAHGRGPVVDKQPDNQAITHRNVKAWEAPRPGKAKVVLYANNWTYGEMGFSKSDGNRKQDLIFSSEQCYHSPMVPTNILSFLETQQNSQSSFKIDFLVQNAQKDPHKFIKTALHWKETNSHWAERVFGQADTKDT